ncbi:MAG: heme biosynthesis protein HemY [Rhizobiaceae bacterium]|nr:heme biosynthesis protein HemY [Rhizobiaceae bacterium]
MFRIAAFILLLFAIAFGFAWLADNPGTVAVQWDWLNQGQVYEFDLITLILVLGVVFFASIVTWWCFFNIINSPKAFGRWRSGRRRDKGFAALSKGLVAAGAGNIPLAKQLAKDSAKLLDEEPLVAMLEAQTALLEDNRPAARQQFNAMLESDQTRLLGLRGLYLEAEKEGAVEAAAHFAKEANNLAPGTPWAATAVLKMQTISGQWEEAIRTLDLNRSSNVFEKEEYNRKKAVVLTALAMQQEEGEPEQGRINALAACKLAPDLAPAATVCARLLVRLNDSRKAGKILETSWRATSHPDIADAYVNLNAGESAAQRLVRARKLTANAQDDREGLFAIAKACLDAGEFKAARDAMEKILRDSASERACLLMADIEQAEYGDRGRVREWLSRAVSAGKDPAWIAEGVVFDEWMPCSPNTGRLDAFEWKAPMHQLGAHKETLDLSRLANEPLQEIEIVDLSPVDTDETPGVKSASNEDVSDAEIVILEPAKAQPENDNVDATEPDFQDTATEVNSTLSDATDPVSPYHQADLDVDKDGVIDHRPDDPGIGPETGEEKPKKEGWLF